MFSSLNAAEVHLVRSLLNREGISSRLRGQDRVGLYGEVPWDDARVELLIDPSDLPAAQALIKGSQRAGAIERPCPRCGEFNPWSFELCWQCGAEFGQ
ncbi:MAG: DUF2007 domain-containing protein [Myxococcales bacterium]|nr:DUF2007 domain-containing protein [Myxococcales bacterium]